MKVRDRSEWQRLVARASKKKYEHAIMNYTERWTSRIVAQLNKGKSFEEAVETTIDEPELRPSNLQLAQAIAILINHWERGEELKDWFNKRWAIVRKEREPDGQDQGILGEGVGDEAGSGRLRCGGTCGVVSCTPGRSR